MTTTSQSPEEYAYHMMAGPPGADDRPNTPSKGPSTPVNVAAREYADNFALESGTFTIGHANYEDRPALVYIIEAARNLAAMDHASAARLLRKALTDIESRHPETLEDTP